METNEEMISPLIILPEPPFPDRDPILLIKKSTLTGIANEIRNKTGSYASIKVSDLSQAITDIPSGGATEPYIEETYNSIGALTNVVFHGYKRISDYAFFNRSSLAISSLPSTITKIGEYAFCGCSELALTTLPAGITTIKQHAFSGCQKMLLDSLPQNIRTISDYAFSDCSSITVRTLPENIEHINKNAFSGCSQLSLETLPPRLLGISSYGFDACSNIRITDIPSTVTTLSQYCFRGCRSLTSITFHSTPFIGTASFTGCTNLTTINVPWAEGAVAGAPWGATNATINYNYTGE